MRMESFPVKSVAIVEMLHKKIQSVCEPGVLCVS